MTPDLEKHRKKPDFMERARQIVEQATGEEPAREESDDDSPKVRRARKAGKAGGPARAKSLTPEQRSEIAKRAAKARWEREKSDSPGDR